MPQNKEVYSKGSRVIGVTQTEIEVEKAAKLLLLCKALDKEVHGVAKKRENLQDLVRHGGLTFRDIKTRLCAT